MLVDQLKSFEILDSFDDVIGLDNHNAESKIQIASNYIKGNNIDTNNVVFIGDTDHDNEVALTVGARSILVARGHQNKNKLLKISNNVVDNLLEALELANEILN